MAHYRCVLIGSGYVAGKHHLPAYQAMENLKVVALCDINERATKYMGDKYGIKRRYTDAEEMLKKEKPDISIIGTPPDTHRIFLEKSLQYGCHVLVEKPLASNLGEVDKMIEYASRFDQKVMVNQEYRWLKESVDAKKIIDDGLIGEPYLVNIVNHLWHTSLVLAAAQINADDWRAELDKLVLFDQGIHMIDLSRYWFGAEAETVYAQIPKLSHYPLKADGLAILQISYPQGKNALIMNDWTSLGGPLNHWDRARIQGRGGCIEIGYNEYLKAYSRKMDCQIVPEGKEEDIWEGANRRLMEHFLECIESNKEPMTSLKDNRKALRIVFSAYESARQNKVIYINQR